MTCCWTLLWCVCYVLCCSVMSNSAILWTVARQAPLSTEFSRQEYWSGLPCPPPGDLSSPGIKPRFATLQANSLPSGPQHLIRWGKKILYQATVWSSLGYLLSTNISSVQFSRSVVSNSLWPHESQHARPPCPSPTPGVHSDSCPSSQRCHPAISSSVVPFSSCPQSLPGSESFPMS